MTLSQELQSFATYLGFDLIGITPIGPPAHGTVYAAWLKAGYHGEMSYLARREAPRLAPSLLAPDARTMILLAVNYYPGPPPIGWDDPARGRIARYAWGKDYHDLIKPKLYALDAFIRARTGRESLSKVCVDTAPLLERDFAVQAGLGFCGRNTCLIRPRLGSWTFLAALLIPEVLTPVTPRSSISGTCGGCTRCLDACPTRAFPAARVLDARRCISYLTIELRDSIPRDMRPLMGNWVFGCDVCQEVCPYNRTAPRGDWLARAADLDRVAPSLLTLLALDAEAFRVRFRGTPVMRAKRRGLLRNACVAAGNWGDPTALPALIALLSDLEPLIRGHAAWALGCIGGRDANRALARALADEQDPQVRDEIEYAQSGAG